MEEIRHHFSENKNPFDRWMLSCSLFLHQYGVRKRSNRGKIIQVSAMSEINDTKQKQEY